MSISLDLIAKILLAPFLIIQGLKIRKTALILPEPTGPRAGKTGTGPLLNLLIIGDSSAAGVGVGTQSQALAGHVVTHLSRSHTVSWRLIAKTGATTRTAITLAAQEPPQRFDVALIALGVNDVTKSIPERRFSKAQSELRILLRTKFGVRRFVISAVPPIERFPALPPLLQWILGAQSARFNDALKSALQNEPDCTYLQLDFPMDPDLMASDGFHPSAKTYAIWGKAAAKALIP